MFVVLGCLSNRTVKVGSMEIRKMYIERSSGRTLGMESGATDCVYIDAGVDNYLKRDPTGAQRNAE